MHELYPEASGLKLRDKLVLVHSWQNPSINQQIPPP
ncbi:MAG: hypothetical protein RIT03_1109 [Bacteroidota bacterium]|jgi:hypothetical protein